MTPSPRPSRRPPKRVLDILTSYFYSTLKRKVRDGLGFDLTCAKVVKKISLKIKILGPLFCIIIILLNLTQMFRANKFTQANKIVHKHA